MKSKYNTGVPIDINELSDEERKQAFHEWAEGSKALENLLIEGYKKGFLSFACCSGDTGKPYISYKLDNDYSKKMAMSVAQELVKSDLDCEVQFEHDFDFCETEEEYKKVREYLLKTFPDEISEEKYSPTRTIRRLHVRPTVENAEEVYGFMAKSIKEASLDNIELPKTKEEVPKKIYKSREIQNSREDASDSKFLSDLKSKTNNEEEITKNDIKEKENPAIEQPNIQAPDTQDIEM